jgi:two-component system, OmpR family, phosphate regulon response regulator PhoB
MITTENERPGDPPAAAEGAGGGSPQRLSVLVVDDEPDAREYMRAFLESEGFTYQHAASGAQALELLREHLPDIIIVDFMMPGMTGLELCEKLRERTATRHVPILVFSAYPLNPHSNAGLYDQALLKPAEFSELLRVIRMLTGTRASSS